MNSTVWNLRARLYDICEGSSLRRGPFKAELFRHMAGKVIFVAVGTGIDIKHFPPDRNITAIDINDEMLCRAGPHARKYPGSFTLLRMDAQNLRLANESFDTAVTSCTMCSVPDPIRALRELYRVLRPGGRLLLFEHVRSRNPVLGLALDGMTRWTRIFGTEMNRDTVGNVKAAGFRITRIDSVYLDIILAIQATKLLPGRPTAWSVI